MKKPFSVIFLIFIASRTLLSGDVLKPDASVLYRPEHIKTGDHVISRIIVRADLDETDAATVYAEESEWFHITDIKVNYKTSEILLWFIPLNPAEKTLPVIKTANIKISGLPVKINPVITESSALSLIRGHVFLPWTRLLFASLVAFAVIVPVGIYYIYSCFYKPAVKAVHAVNKKAERKRLLKKLEKLAVSGSWYDCESYCTILIDTLKRYLSAATGIRAQYLTSEELLEKSEMPADVIRFCDSVRFGSVFAETEALEEAAGKLVFYAVNVEKKHE